MVSHPQEILVGCRLLIRRRMKFIEWLLLAIIAGFSVSAVANPASSFASSTALRYVPLGDSYTRGKGVPQEDTWPMLLTRHLQAEGIDIELSVNPAQNGATLKKVLDEQVPILFKKRATLVTVLIGVNDWVRGTGSRRFTQRLKRLLSTLLDFLPARERLLLITLPDFSCSPLGKTFGYGKSAPNGLTRFNNIIKRLAQEKGLWVVDLFPLSREICQEPGMFTQDELHPSRKQYVEWEKLIYPIMRKMLSAEKVSEEP